jgi:hypothetical protein
MESLAQIVAVMSLFLWLIGPLSIFLASKDYVPFFLVLFFV